MKNKKPEPPVRLPDYSQPTKYTEGGVLTREMIEQYLKEQGWLK